MNAALARNALVPCGSDENSAGDVCACFETEMQFRLSVSLQRLCRLCSALDTTLAASAYLETLCAALRSG